MLEEGADWVPTSAENESAQFLQTREFQVADIARWFRVPPHLIGAMERSTTWGTGIEAMSIGFVMFTLGSWITRWEESTDRSLITATPFYYAKMIPAALLKGDTLSRYQAHQIAGGGNAPFLTVNEIRELEDRNPLPGGDDLAKPLNMGTAQGKPAPPPAPPGGGTDGAALAPAGGSGEPLLLALVRDTAARLVHKEVTVMRKAAARCASDAEAWGAAVGNFYHEHQTAVAAALLLPVEVARHYALEQGWALVTQGVGVLADWEIRRVDDLVALALGEGKSDEI